MPLEFEKPILELERRIAELKETAKATGVDLEAEIRLLEERLARLRKETYENLTLAAGPAGPGLREAHHPGRPGEGLPGLHRAPRGPGLRRRPRHRGGARLPGGGEGGGGGAPEGPGHQGEPPAQLRHAPPRGVPQGHAPHGPGGPFRLPLSHLRGHPRGLPRGLRRRAGPGLGHRPEHSADEPPPGPRRDGDPGGGGSGGPWPSPWPTGSSSWRTPGTP